MKTQLQSLFMALLLVFAVLPASILAQEEPDRQATEPVIIVDNTFWLYPGDQRKLESNLVLTYEGPSQKPTQMACTEELKLCPDGKTYVGRDSNRNCAWNACPGEGIVVVADQGVCEQFSMTFTTPAVLNKPLPPDANYGFSPYYTPSYKEEYKKLAAAFQADYDRAIAAGDEEAIMKVKKAFEEQLQALSKKYSVKTSDDVAYAYPEKEDSDVVGSYDFEDFPEDEEVAKLKKEFERKYAEAIAEGDEEKIAKLKEEYLRKFDKLVTKKYDADTYKQPTIKPMPLTPPTYTGDPMRSETKTFCILPGEVGYPIMLYEKKDGGVLVGYTAWKGENPSSYVAARGATGAVQALRQANLIKDEDACQVEGNGAVQVGIRLNVKGESQYCDALTKKMMVQKQDGEQAENDYECKSNESRNGQCVSSYNFLQKIWKGITSIFGF